MCSWIWIIRNVDLCLSVCILMWSFDLAMHYKLGACPKFLNYVHVFNVCSQDDLWLEGVFNVSVYLMSIMLNQLLVWFSISRGSCRVLNSHYSSNVEEK